MGARGSRAWGPCDGHGKGAWGGEEGGAGGHAPGPFKGPWETCMGGRGVWVVAAMWDPGAMSWSGVEGMEPGLRAGAMSHGCQAWAMDMGRVGGGESGEGGAGGHAPAPLK